MTKDELKKYLYAVLSLEKKLYIIDRAIDVTNNKATHISFNESKPKIKFWDKVEVAWSGLIVGAIVGGIGWLILRFLLNIQKFNFVACVFWGVLLCVIIFLTMLGDENNKKIDDYNNRKLKNKKTNQNINKKNEILSRYNIILRNLKVDVNNTLNMLYDKNIIHPKYRNFAAVASLYEYIDTGICSRLEGENGAYKNLEYLIRLDKIVIKLDRILYSLESIKQNQFQMYTEIKNCNNAINNLSTSFNKSVDKVINSNIGIEKAVNNNTELNDFRLKTIQDNQFYQRNYKNTFY